MIEQADAVNSEYDLMRIAVGLVLNATAERIAAERIIALLRSNEEPAAPVPDVPAEPVEKKKPEPKKKPSDKKK